jgi:glycosyltransferase involved in cell wall biosynthesis
LNVLHLSTHVDIGGITSYIGTLSKALSKKGHQSSVVSSGGNAWSMLARAGVLSYDFPIRTKNELNPKLWWALPQIVSLVKEERYDILHAHSRVTQVMAHFISKFTGVPAVSTAHGFYRPRLGRRVFPAWGERVVAISPLVAESLKNDHHVDPRKIRVIYNAIDLENFMRRLGQQDREWLKQRYGIPLNSFVVGSLSRLVQDKGHEYLIEAVRRVAQERPDIFLLIVGDGREKAALERAAAKALPGRVKMIPGVQDTTAVLSMMDVFAHAATWREGFGLSIAEAMIAQVPVVATDIPAINTLLKDGENGRVVAPKDAAALASAISDLARDSGRARALGQEGHETALALCRPERMAEEMEALYQETIEEWKKR